MDLLHRYLHAVRFWLPAAQQDDIIAELGEDLRAQIDDRETALGHSLHDDEVAAILKQRGHPMLVAGRYLPQRSLIGPALFPAYQFVLKLVIAWILAPVFILVVGPVTVLSSRSPSVAIIGTLWTLLMAAVFAFGVITLIFTILERYPHESTFRWNPRRLPRVPPTKAATWPQPVPGYKAVVEMLAGVCATLVWLDVWWAMSVPASFALGAVSITLAPILRSFFWPVLLLTLGRVALGWIGWLRPWWTRTRPALRLALDAIALILLGALGSTGPWVRVAASLPAPVVANANLWANVGVSIGLAVAWIISLVAALREARLLLRSPVKRGPSPKSANLVV